MRKQKHFAKGQTYYDGGKYSEALIEFGNAVQIDPEFAEAHYYLARCFLRTGQYPLAVRELGRTLEIQPRNWKAHIDTGNLMLAAGELSGARDNAEVVLDNVPDDVDARVLLAKVHAARGDTDRAMTEMQKAVLIDPNRADSYIDLALIEQGAKPAQAEQDFKKGLELNPKSLIGAVAIAGFYQQQRRLDEAERAYLYVLRLQPENVVVRNALVRVFLSSGRRDAAEQLLVEAKSSFPKDPRMYSLLGDFYVQLGVLDRAMFEFASLLHQHPHDLNVKKKYIWLLIEHKRLPEATRLNDEILAQSANDRDALVLRAQILLAGSQVQPALEILRDLAHNQPAEPNVHYQLGYTLRMAGDLDSAEHEMYEALRLDPSMVQAQQQLAEMALSRGNPDLLLKFAEALIAAQPWDGRWYVYRAEAGLIRDRTAQAENDLNLAMRLMPHTPAPVYMFAQLRLNQGKLAEAEALFNRVLELDPGYGPALQSLTQMYLRRRQPEKAIAFLDARIANSGGSSLLHLLRGSVLLTTGRYDDAALALQRAIELDNRNTDAYVLLAQLNGVRSSIPQAIAVCERSIQANPKDVRPYVLLGSLEEARGNWQRAEDVYRKALQVQPDHPVAANNLAYLMVEHSENLDVAASLAQTAHRAMPDSPAAADTLGWAYYRKGAYSLAVDLLQEALKRSPNEPVFHYHLGLAYYAAHDPENARIHLRRALELNPKSAEAEEIKKVLKSLDHA
ncbi:MAG: tetratricopeptide repeat protein [Acidobacteriia bacterium]|nr:tetratricopeptide repeat protein [Terriglobia bacterium]